MLCSLSIDDLSHPAPWGQIEDTIAEAAELHSVAIMHAHIPDTTISRGAIDRVLTLAEDHGLDYVTFDELVGPATPRAALALAFDDNAVDSWFSIRELLASHGARVTFFVARWDSRSAVELDELRELAADGHDLEPHSVNHLAAVDYVAAHGLDAYVADEVVPSIQIMREAGYRPTTFAYPFGQHDDEIDRAVLAVIPKVRTTPGGCR